MRESRNSVPELTVLVLGDVVDALRCIVGAGASIRDFDLEPQRGAGAMRVSARTGAASEALRRMLAAGVAVALSAAAHLPHPSNRPPPLAGN